MDLVPVFHGIIPALHNFRLDYSGNYVYKYMCEVVMYHI